MNRQILEARNQLNIALYDMLSATSMKHFEQAERRVRHLRAELPYLYRDLIIDREDYEERELWADPWYKTQDELYASY